MGLLACRRPHYLHCNGLRHTRLANLHSKPETPTHHRAGFLPQIYSLVSRLAKEMALLAYAQAKENR